MGGLHFESLADLPPGMRNQVAVHITARVLAEKIGQGLEHPEAEKHMRFDLEQKSERYQQLMDAVREGIIYSLRLQQNFTLQEAYTTEKGKRIQAIVYQADFTYRVRWPWHSMPTSCSEDDLIHWASMASDRGDGALIIEDVKSKATTKGHINKRKMMAAKGYIIREV